MTETLCPAEHDLLALLSGEPDAAALQAHVDGCAECRRRMRRLQSGFSTLLLRTGTAAQADSSTAAAATPAGVADYPPFIGKYFIAGPRPGPEDAITTYRGTHAFLKQDVMIHLGRKAFAPDDDARRLLIAEGKKLLELHHPSLARVYDLDFHQGQPYLVEEYVDGPDLAAYVEQEKPSPQQAALLVAQLAEGLAAAHARGLAHQRILPHAVVIDNTGRPRLTGFGVARLRELAAGPAGPADATTGPRGDVFGLGGVLHFLLTRQMPPAASPTGEQAAFGSNLPDRDALKAASVPHDLRDLCLRALAATTAAPPLPLADFAQKLRRIAQGKKPPYLAIAIGIGLVLLAAGAVWFWSRAA